MWSRRQCRSVRSPTSLRPRLKRDVPLLRQHPANDLRKRRLSARVARNRIAAPFLSEARLLASGRAGKRWADLSRWLRDLGFCFPARPLAKSNNSERPIISFFGILQETISAYQRLDSAMVRCMALRSCSFVSRMRMSVRISDCGCDLPLPRDGSGRWSALVASARAGAREACRTESCRPGGSQEWLVEASVVGVDVGVDGDGDGPGMAQWGAEWRSSRDRARKRTRKWLILRAMYAQRPSNTRMELAA